MAQAPSVAEWLFKCLSAETKLDELEAEGIALRAENDPAAVQNSVPLQDFSADIRRSAMRALPVFLAFFCLENGVRELVSERMIDRFGSDWWEHQASVPLKRKVQERKEKEGRNRWHARRGEQELFYTDFGDLKDLVQSKWDVFEDLFPDQNWVAARLDELEASRNIIAHSNLLDEREVTRVRLYLQDWTRQVG
jgi:hypothetical protein